MVGIQKQSSYININVIENSSTRETGLLHYTDAIFSPYRLSFRGALSSKFVCYAARVTYDPLNSVTTCSSLTTNFSMAVYLCSCPLG